MARDCSIRKENYGGLAAALGMLEEKYVLAENLKIIFGCCAKEVSRAARKLWQIIEMSPQNNRSSLLLLKKALGEQPSPVYSDAIRDEIARIYNEKKGLLKPRKKGGYKKNKKCTKAEFESAVVALYEAGQPVSLSRVARKLGCSYQQFTQRNKDSTRLQRWYPELETYEKIFAHVIATKVEGVDVSSTQAAALG